MALIVTHDNKRHAVSPEKGLAIYQVLNGEIEGTPEQEKFCEQVKSVYLNWRNAPKSYVQRHYRTLESMGAFVEN